MAKVGIKIHPLVILLVASFVILGKAGDSNEDVTSKLQIHVPTELRKDGGYDHIEALFGVPAYAGAIIENVYYADDPMCSDDFNKRGGYPQRVRDEKGQHLPWPRPFILMIDRGGCTVIQKVRNAERAGAAAVIIADNFCQCKLEHLCKSEPGIDCEDREPVMADDGAGSDVSIPSMLMLKQDADSLKAALFVGKPVRMEFRWSPPTPVDTVTYQFWTTPADTTSEHLQLEFKEAALALKGNAKFSPRMYLYDGRVSGCISQKSGKNSCQNLCTNNGRYCAFAPETHFATPISGVDVVIESLRRLCIWQIYGFDGLGQIWWEYVHYFTEKCGLQLFTDNNCILDSMKQTGIDSDAVSKCMDQSGGTEKDVENNLLASEIHIRTKSQVTILPDIRVNGAAIQGNLDFKNVFQALCTQYSDGIAPAICHNCANCYDVKTCVKNQICRSSTGSTMSNNSFVLIVLGVVLFSTIGVMGGYKFHQKRMQKQIRVVLSEYMPVGKEEKIDFTISDQSEYT